MLHEYSSINNPYVINLTYLEGNNVTHAITKHTITANKLCSV